MTPKQLTNRWGVVLPCLAYSCSSISMVLLNKILISNYEFSLPTVLLIYQNLIAVFLLNGAKMAGWVEFPSFNPEIAKKWLPVNIVFVGMLLTGFMSLGHLAVPMVTIFKNVANIFIVAGEYYFLGEQVSSFTVGSLVVVVMSSVFGAFSDIHFDFIGYFWMLLNCCCTAGYVLFMRFWSSNQSLKLSRHEMVFYNNFLSLPVLFFVVMVNGELGEVAFFMDRFTFNFFLLATASGVIGFGLSFASFWCVGATTATTYAVVGAMNKIPLTVVSVLLFDTILSARGGLAVVMSMMGGLLYSYSKILAKNKARATSGDSKEPVGGRDGESSGQESELTPLNLAQLKETRGDVEEGRKP